MPLYTRGDFRPPYSGMWYEVNNIESLPSPAVLVSAERVAANIEACISLAGSPERLRPHVKTHKSSSVMRMHLDRGITRFKCATVAEAAMVATAGSRDILLAYQPVGPAVDSLCALAGQFENTRFACLVDNSASLEAIERAAARAGVRLSVYIDLDVGMHRTGIEPGDAACELYRAVHDSEVLAAGGMHAYDGHIRDNDISIRRANARKSRELAFALRDRLLSEEMSVPEIVLGGTPTFPCHAAAYENGVALSPGTYVYHDWGYETHFPDLPFEMAAVVFGRVISVPRAGRFTVDIGSKAIAADPEQPRGLLLNMPEATAGAQSEEHWVFSVREERTLSVGEPVFVWPRHICPTIAHHDAVAVCGANGEIAEWWNTNSRGRSIHGNT